MSRAQHRTPSKLSEALSDMPGHTVLFVQTRTSLIPYEPLWPWVAQPTPRRLRCHSNPQNEGDHISLSSVIHHHGRETHCHRLLQHLAEHLREQMLLLLKMIAKVTQHRSCHHLQDAIMDIPHYYGSKNGNCHHHHPTPFRKWDTGIQSGAVHGNRTVMTPARILSDSL